MTIRSAIKMTKLTVVFTINTLREFFVNVQKHELLIVITDVLMCCIIMSYSVQ